MESRAQAGPTGPGIEAAVLGDLSDVLDGELIVPGDPDYDDARGLWNGMVDRHPAAIARCAGPEEIARCALLARESGAPLAVRGGGHNVAGNAVCDGGLVIDLSAIRSVRVDPDARTARVGAGCLLADFDREAQRFGLAAPAGIVSTTGLAGLTLGGGFGWLSRALGLTIDSLVAVELVSADGGALTASAEENPDLFWAMRGGGGNFGVATAFEFQLHEVGPEVLCGLIVRPFEEAAEYLRFYRERVASAPPELSAWTVIRHAPPLPFLPAEAHGDLVLVTAFLHLGKEEEGRELVEPLLGFGRPHGASLGLQPYVDWQQGFDALNAPGARNYWKSHNLAELSDGAIDAILEHAARLPSPQCELFLPHLGGGVRRVPAESTAYAHRDAEFVLNVHTRWEEPADDQRCIGWARELFDAVAPHATGGTYVNFLGDEGRHRVRDAYPGEAWERLVGVKRRYDPGNLFRLNQNIDPDAG